MSQHSSHCNTCEVHTTHKKSLTSRLWRAGIAVIIALIATRMLVPVIQRVVPSATVTASFGAMVLLGLVASVSTCLASTGGFLLSYTAQHATKRRSVLIHVGRLTSFIVGGALLGALSSALPTVSIVWYGVFCTCSRCRFFRCGITYA